MVWYGMVLIFMNSSLETTFTTFAAGSTFPKIFEKMLSILLHYHIIGDNFGTGIFNDINLDNGNNDKIFFWGVQIFYVNNCGGV